MNYLERLYNFKMKIKKWCEIFFGLVLFKLVMEFIRNRYVRYRDEIFFIIFLRCECETYLYSVWWVNWKILFVYFICMKLI